MGQVTSWLGGYLFSLLFPDLVFFTSAGNTVALYLGNQVRLEVQTFGLYPIMKVGML